MMLSREEIAQIVREEVRRLFAQEMDDHVRAVTINALKQCGLEELMRHMSGRDKPN